MCITLFGLNGCVPAIPSLEPSSTVLAAGAFDFKWRLSGERAIAPVQVFNNQQQVWLQFLPEQHLPAIFAYQEGQYHALQYQHFDPYVVIEGQWRELLFQGGRLQAHAQHDSVRLAGAGQQSQQAMAAKTVMPAAMSVTQSDPKSNTQSKPTPLEISDEKPLTAQTAKKQQKKAVTNKSGEINLSVDKNQQVTATAVQKERIKKFAIGPADETMRQALQRWAKQVGWHFGDEHWGPEMDYPIMNTAEFNASFENAVEQLLDSVQLGAQPLRACFYSNRVLRIIPESQSCLPTGHGRDSNGTAIKKS
ncbi:MAG TPA: TcpQ domain-containing protein [Paenalcaligenes sp.]|nr:TcpQ domain-containing protein [Paenalcaligenes sp.]